MRAQLRQNFCKQVAYTVRYLHNLKPASWLVAGRDDMVLSSKVELRLFFNRAVPHAAISYRERKCYRIERLWTSKFMWPATFLISVKLAFISCFEWYWQLKEFQVHRRKLPTCNKSRCFRLMMQRRLWLQWSFHRLSLCLFLAITSHGFVGTVW